MNEPETMIAFLHNGKKFTRHTFVRRESAAYFGGDGKAISMGSAMIYKCSETEKERRWGFEHSQRGVAS